MKKYTKNDLVFIQHVKNECKRLGVKTHIKDVKYVKLSKSIRCSGYFDDGENLNVQPVLACSMNSPMGLQILVHEYCHLTQWQDGIKLWNEYNNKGFKVDEWLEGKNIRNIRKYIQLAIDLELDNERRSVKMIKKWGLSIDIKMYIKQANAYLQFYNWMLQTRKWSKPNNTPYSNKRIIAGMPDSFRMDYTKLPKRLEKLYKEENI
jgi:hypothetical protein